MLRQCFVAEDTGEEDSTSPNIYQTARCKVKGTKKAKDGERERVKIVHYSFKELVVKSSKAETEFKREVSVLTTKLMVV